MKIPLVEGREFIDRDTSSHSGRCDQRNAGAALWPMLTRSASVYAESLRFTAGREIVGVAHETPVTSETTIHGRYCTSRFRSGRLMSRRRAGTRIAMFMLRTTGDPLSAIPAVWRAATEVWIRRCPERHSDTGEGTRAGAPVSARVFAATGRVCGGGHPARGHRHLRRHGLRGRPAHAGNRHPDGARCQRRPGDSPSCSGAR